MAIPELNVGDVALGPEYFLAPHFSDDCTSLPDRPTAANPTGTGKFNDQHWQQDINYRGGWADGPVPHTGTIVNKERQRYVTGIDPTPDGWQPIEQTPDGWLMKAREVPDTPAYKAWAIGKGYEYQGPKGYPNWPPGKPRYVSEWPDRASIPGTEGLDWIESTDDKTLGQVILLFPHGGREKRVADYPSRASIPGTEGVDWFEEGAGGLVRHDKRPLTWESTMLNTNNSRASITQGELEVVCKLAAGSRYVDGGDVTSQEVACGSIFTMQQSPVGRGSNREVLADGTTIKPFTGGDLLNELDLVEHGGFDVIATHHSRHSYSGRIVRNKDTGKLESEKLTSGEHAVVPGLDVTKVLTRFKLQITPKWVYMCSGPADGPCIVRARYETTPFFRQTQRLFDLDPNDPSQAKRDANFVPIETGDLIIDGQPVPPESMIIICLPISLGFLRDRMIWERQTILNRGQTYPPFGNENGLATASMLVRSIKISHLKEAEFTRHDGSIWKPYENGSVPAPVPATTPIVTAQPIDEELRGVIVGARELDPGEVGTLHCQITNNPHNKKLRFEWTHNLPESAGVWLTSTTASSIGISSLSGLTADQVASVRCSFFEITPA